MPIIIGRINITVCVGVNKWTSNSKVLKFFMGGKVGNKKLKIPKKVKIRDTCFTSVIKLEETFQWKSQKYE